MLSRRHLILSLGAATIAGCAPGARTNPLSRGLVQSLRFSDIEVVTRTASFESGRARDFSSRLGPELQAELTQAFDERMGGTSDTVLIVEISRLNIASSSSTAFGRDQSALQGTARVVSQRQGVLATYPVQVFAGDPSESTTGALLSTALNRSSGYYRTLVAEFADQTREQILA